MPSQVDLGFTTAWPVAWLLGGGPATCGFLWAEDSKPRKWLLIFAPGPVFVRVEQLYTVILHDLSWHLPFGHAACSTDPIFVSMSPARTIPGPALS